MYFIEEKNIFTFYIILPDSVTSVNTNKSGKRARKKYACYSTRLSMCSACLTDSTVACVQPVFSLCSVCSACVQPVFNLCSACVQPVFSLCSACVQPVFSMCSACVQPVFSMSNRLHHSMCCTILRCNQVLNKTSSYALKFKRTFNLTAYKKVDLKNFFNFILQIFQVENFCLKYSQIVKAVQKRS